MAGSLTQLTLSMLADVAKGKVRCVVEKGRPVAYVGGWQATGTELDVIKRLQLAQHITPAEDGLYVLTSAGQAHLNRNFPTWE